MKSRAGCEVESGLKWRNVVVGGKSIKWRAMDVLLQGAGAAHWQSLQGWARSKGGTSVEPTMRARPPQQFYQALLL